MSDLWWTAAVRDPEEKKTLARGDTLYLHGSAASRIVAHTERGIPFA